MQKGREETEGGREGEKGGGEGKREGVGEGGGEGGREEGRGKKQEGLLPDQVSRKVPVPREAKVEGRQPFCTNHPADQHHPTGL